MLFPSALLITLSAPTLPLSHLLLPSNSFFFPSSFASAPCSSTLDHIWTSPAALRQSQPCCSSSGCGCQRKAVADIEQNLPQNIGASGCLLLLEGAVVANIVLLCESGLPHARYTEKLWGILMQNSKKSPMNVGNWFLQASSEYSSFHGGEQKAYTWQ